MGEPGFWDDQQQAARISTEHSRVAKRLERYDRLLRDYEDARGNGFAAVILHAHARELRAALDEPVPADQPAQALSA